MSRNLLAYLSKIPAKLAQSQDLNTSPAAKRLVAECCLDWGNCLLWIQPQLEPGAPHHEQPLNEGAQSVWALGKQFRAVGMALWDQPEQQPDKLDRLTHEVESLCRAVNRALSNRLFDAMHKAADEREGA